MISALMWSFGGGQGRRQLAELGLAFVLSTLIGIERELGQKSAGLRTHTLVGVGSALFMEVSQHGFGDVRNVGLDPSRVAAQIVSGIGFIGGGLIFVRRDSVRGLTTAATVWLTCAIGMACAGGLGFLATVCTAAHFLVIRGYPLLLRRVSPALAAGQFHIHLTYTIGSGLLPRVLETCTGAGFRVLDTRVEHAPWIGGQRTGDRREDPPGGRNAPDRTGATADLRLSLQGRGDVQRLAADLAALDGMLAVTAGDSEPAE